MRRLIIAAAVVALSLPAFAQGYGSSVPSPRVDQRQANQAERLHRGQQDGSLSRREAARISAGQARIDRMERQFEADGRVTPRERRLLAEAQNKQSRLINAQRRDNNNR